MKLKEKLKNYKDEINKSPLQGVKWQDESGSKINISKKLTSYQKQIENLEEKIQQTMNVVVMGEVKAGKSTLLNAIVGEKIAPTDVLEATSAISDIHFSESKEAAISRNGEIEEMGSIKEIYEILEKHQNDQEFFDDSLKVSIGMPLKALKEFHLVDTPGLSTITKANENKTKNFIEESDVVLWVLNANHIGQSDVREKLAEVAKMGKPIIAIINRIDEIDSNPARIEKFVQKKLGIYLQKIFSTNAKGAYEAVKESDQKKLKESGLTDLLQYLREEIEIKSEKVKKDSIESSAKAVMKHYIKFHHLYFNRIQFIKNKLQEYTQELNLKKDEIENEVERYILDEFETELFANEKREILNMFKQMRGLDKIFDTSISKKDVKKYVKSEINKQKVINWWKKTEKEVSKMLKKRWSSFAEEMDKKMEKDFQKLARKENMIFTEMNNLSEQNESIINEVGQGAAIAGIGGVGMAAYIAGLGPSAAYITFGSALSSVVPPLAIGGAIIYGLKKVLNRDKRLNDLENQIFDQIKDAKKTVKNKWIEKEVIPQIKKKNKKISDKLKDEFARKLTVGMSVEELKDLEYDIKNYIDNLEFEFIDEFDLSELDMESEQETDKDNNKSNNEKNYNLKNEKYNYGIMKNKIKKKFKNRDDINLNKFNNENNNKGI